MSRASIRSGLDRRLAICRKVFLIVAGAVLAASLAEPTVAAVGIQREANGCGYSTVGDALANAQPGDLVLVEPGIYSENSLLIDMDLEISAATAGCTQRDTPTSRPVIDGTNSGRVIQLMGTGVEKIVLRHLSIVNGSAPSGDGGLIDAFGVELSVLGSHLSGGSARRGGAINLNLSQLVLDNSLVELSSAELFGGGLACVNQAQASVVNATFRQNSAIVEGGAIYARDCVLDLLGSSSLHNNVATATAPAPGTCRSGGGGGICAPASVVTMHDNTTIWGNCGGNGGGVIIPAGPAEFHMRDNSRVFQNYSGSFGGGVRAHISGDAPDEPILVRLSHNASVHHNSSGGFAGGIGLTGAKIEMSRGTSVLNNSAEADGGGLYAANGTTGALEGVRIEFNTTLRSGGGLLVNGSSTLDVSDSWINENEAGQLGGGILASSGAEVSVSMSDASEICSSPAAVAKNRYCSEISRNLAGDSGGAIAIVRDNVDNTSVTVWQTGLQGNEANLAAVASVGSGTHLHLTRSLVARNNNTGTIIDGVISVEDGGHAGIVFDTITDNTANGVAYAPASTGIIIGSILYDNFPFDSDIQSVAVSGTCNTARLFMGMGVPGATTSDPKFVETPRGRYRLGNMSAPSVLDQCGPGAGTDLDLKPRHQGAALEKGAFEN